MTFADFIKLYILQKDYHEKGVANTASYHFPEAIKKIYRDLEVEVSTEIAPPLDGIEGQPPIPYVIFRPKTATTNTPKPVIVHTHGGPNVYFSEDTPHAEIAYFLSQGYVVVCPNYRGSTDCPANYPDASAWKTWVKQAIASERWIEGAEDVYAVTQAILKNDFVNGDHIVLRGGSKGSHINAWLLAEIKKGRFKQLYSGAHLSGGLDYPSADEIPENFPLLITHSVNDDVAPFAPAKQFMLDLLEKRSGFVQTFVSQTGGHHFIHPSVVNESQDSFAKSEMVSYLQLMQSFADTVLSGKAYPVSDVKSQLAQHQDPRINQEIPSDDIIRLFHEYIQSKLNNETKAITTEMVASNDSTVLSPTMAHIKLFLGDSFTGVIEDDLRLFFKEHYQPNQWNGHQLTGKIKDAGQRILADEAFFQDLVNIAEFEQIQCNTHPDHMSLYHTCNYETLLLYCFIQLWRESLRGEFKSEIDMINMLRMYDFTSASFADIHSFLKYMRENFKDNVESDLIGPDHFNYAMGFSERALACNFALTGNSQCTASSSLWWHFESDNTKSERHTKRVIVEFLGLIGIYQPEKVQRYLDFIKTEVRKCIENNEKQSALFQFMAPYAAADDKAYVCEMFGMELKDAETDLAKPSHMKLFRENPEAFEADLRARRSAFNNPEKQDQDAEDFKFADQLQVRLLAEPTLTQRVRLSIRNPSMFRKASIEMAKLVHEDCSFYLASKTTVPEKVIAGANLFKAHLRSELGLNTTNEVSDELLLLQQRALHEHATSDIDINFLCHTWKDLPKERKGRVQDKLFAERILEQERRHLFKLCNYIRGYTYYDLVMMIVDQTLGKYADIKDPYNRKQAQEDYEFVIKMIEHFANPSSADMACYDHDYHRLKGLLFHHRAKIDLSTFDCYRYPKRSASPVDLASFDFECALMCVMHYAWLAKERTYGEKPDTSYLKLY